MRRRELIVALMPRQRSRTPRRSAMSLNGFLSGHTEQQAEQGEF
jgi:hypothetical protein